MRISTSQMTNIMLSSMQGSTTQVNKTFIQLNSGERMLEASDDPLGAVQLMMLDREQSDIGQYKKNISNLQTQLGQTESHLKASNTAVLRAQELVTGVLNASNSTMEGREAIATELESILEQLTDIANTKSPNGDYIFAGTKTDTQPIVKDAATGKYTFAGNSDQREVRVAESMSIPANQTADAIFGDVFNTLDSVVKDLRDPAIEGSSLKDSVTSAQTELKSSLNSINRAMTEVGGHQNSLTMISGSHDDNKLINDKLIGEVKDLDYSEAILQLKTQMAALQATQMTYSKVQDLSLFKMI